MNRLQSLAAVLALFLLPQVARAAEADNWPRFRGPNGAGVSEAATVPAQWTEKDYNWKVELPGGGHSSPVVWGDRIFVTSGLDDTGRRMVLCLKAADGSVLWKREYESPVCKNEQPQFLRLHYTCR
jgi:outer membrane protein assembly factor BamB